MWPHFSLKGKNMFNGIIDVSHWSGYNLDFAEAAGAGIRGVIHKSTQGIGYIDPMYESNRQKALTAGLLFGAYHFGTGEEGGSQADFFLQKVGPQPNELLALDFEPNIGGPSMTLEEARAFVMVVHDKTGKWPVLYGGHYLKEHLGSQPDAVLSRCPLWLAQYGPVAVVPTGWSTWAIWQYTDGIAGPNPQPVPGIGHCDRDQFIGDADNLPSFWASVSA
jgi:lysozyme